MSFKLTLLLLVVLVGFIRAEPLPQATDDVEQPAETPQEARPDEEEAVDKQHVEDGSEDQEDEPDQQVPKEEDQVDPAPESEDKSETSELEKEDKEEPAENEDDSSAEKRAKRRYFVHRWRCARYYRHCSRLKTCVRRWGRNFCSRIWHLCFRYHHGYRYCCRKYYCTLWKWRWVWQWCWRRRISIRPPRYRLYCPCRYGFRIIGGRKIYGWWYGIRKCNYRRRIRQRYCARRLYFGPVYYC